MSRKKIELGSTMHGLTTIVKVVGEWLHNNFRIGFKAHLLGYKRFGLGVTSQQQKVTRKQIMRKMQLVKHVPTKLQPSIERQWKVRVWGGF
jgi:hypothetical protein